VFSQIEIARERLAPYLPATPIVLSEALSRMTSRRVWLKLECMQPTDDRPMARHR
jgi:threonine dehydratase